MKKTRIGLACLILFPSLLYFFFELTQANFKKMPFYGPKTVVSKGDTIYYSVKDSYFHTTNDSVIIDTVNYPVYAFVYLDPALRNEGYKMKGILDYASYKANELKDVPLILISQDNLADYDSLKIKPMSVHVFSCSLNRKEFLANTYFKAKPYYVFDYFIVLVDKKRHIRGYYDPNQNSEIKRLIQEYKHLKIRDEYAQTLKKNEVGKNEKK